MPSIIIHSVLITLLMIGYMQAASYAAHQRTRLRALYDIEGSVFCDWHDHCCWDTCAVCQEARHIRAKVASTAATQLDAEQQGAHPIGAVSEPSHASAPVQEAMSPMP